MLIEMSVTNFRSFRERQTLSLVATSSKELARTNTFHTGIKNLPSLLRALAIYGPNAAGKTNLIRAALAMQQIVIASAASGQVGQQLGVQPFALTRATRQAPSEFEVHFIQDSIRYQYGFAVTATRVVREWLTAYPNGRPQNWFLRTQDVRSDKTQWTISAKLKGPQKVWRDATRPNALFLSTAVQLNNLQLKPVFDWFQEQMVVVIPGIELNPYLTYNLFSDQTGKEKVLEFLNAADLRMKDIMVKREPLNLAPQMGSPPALRGHIIATGPGKLESFSATAFHQATDGKELVPLDMTEESHGTQQLFRSTGGFIKVLSTGAVAFIDEIDGSLHPKIVRFLVELFQNPKVNKLNAQLIFSTHDTSILTNDLLRRDQIWFVEREKSEKTNLYPLSDFKGRQDEAFEKNYLKGRYGALPIVGEISFDGR